MRFRLWILRRRFADRAGRLWRVPAIAALGNLFGKVLGVLVISTALLLLGAVIIYGIFRMIPQKGFASFDVTDFDAVECNYFASRSGARVFSANAVPTRNMEWLCRASLNPESPMNALVFCDGVWIHDEYYPTEEMNLLFTGGIQFWVEETEAVDVIYHNNGPENYYAGSIPEPDSYFRMVRNITHEDHRYIPMRSAPLTANSYTTLIADIRLSNAEGILNYTGASPQPEIFHPYQQSCAFFAAAPEKLTARDGEVLYFTENDSGLTLTGTLDTLDCQLKGTFADVLLSGNSLTPTFDSWIYGNYGAVVLAVISSLFGGTLLAFKRREK